ncbi:MAG: Uma2 family endonuclease [Planctomycetes bacterium]|nr:Uma2 family endonuclease [Planctomycetota bacterium]
MKAIVLGVSETELAQRHRLGLDRFDEMWEGVLHMVPAPSPEHARIVDDLLCFVRNLQANRPGGRVAASINVFRRGREGRDYRVPDLSWFAAGRQDVFDEVGAIEAPDTVVEVRSPGDETYDKLPFYADIGVREAVVIDRDSKTPEVFRLAGSKYVGVAADREGWVVAEALRIRFRMIAGASPRLVAEDLDDPTRRLEI